MFPNLARVLPAIMTTAFATPTAGFHWVGVGWIAVMVFLPRSIRFLFGLGGGVVLIATAILGQMTLAFGLGFSFCLIIALGWSPPLEKRILWAAIPGISLLFLAPLESRVFAIISCAIGIYALFRSARPARVSLGLLIPVLLMLVIPFSFAPIGLWTAGSGAQSQQTDPATITVHIGSDLPHGAEEPGSVALIPTIDTDDLQDVALPARILEWLFYGVLLLSFLTLIRLLWLIIVTRSRIARMWWVVALGFAAGAFFLNLWLSNYQPDPMEITLPGVPTEGQTYSVEFIRDPSLDLEAADSGEPPPRPSLAAVRGALLWGLVVLLIGAILGWLRIIMRKVSPEPKYAHAQDPPDGEGETGWDDLSSLSGPSLVRALYQRIRKQKYPGLDPLTPNELSKKADDPDLAQITEVFSSIEYRKILPKITDIAVWKLFSSIMKRSRD